VPKVDRATGRVVAVIVLLIVIAASLRGYLPGVVRSDREQSSHGGASLVYIAALLSGSLVIAGLAVVYRLRNPRQVASNATELPPRFSPGRGRPAWKVMLIGAVVLTVWLLLLWLLSQFVVPHGVDQPRSAPASGAAPPAGNPPQRPGPPDDGGDRQVLRYLTASTMALLMILVAGAIVARRRRVAEVPTSPAQPFGQPAPVAAAATSLVRAAESGLAEIEDPSREPRQAIIACYAAMERQLRKFPGAVPQDFDTPTEVLARAVDNHALNVDNAAELVNLFEEARFSPHVMTEEHRSRAVDVLQLVLADMRSPV
jgi:hypothetical protein